MSHFKIKINLNKINGAFVTSIQGKNSTEECVCIPIRIANLFKSEKTGSVYLDLMAWETKTQLQSGDTHLIKRSLSKEENAALTPEQKNAMPTIGNLHPLTSQSQSQPQVGGNEYQQAVASNQYPDIPQQQGGLPF